MNKKLIWIFSGLVLLVVFYYFAKHKIGERQAHIVDSMVGIEFKDDITFIGSILPILCQEDDKISVLLTAVALDSPEADPNSLKREINRITRDVPAVFSRTQPLNPWQKSFISAIQPCLADLKKIPADSDPDSEDSKEIFDDIKACMESNIEPIKLEIISHFSNRILKNVTNHYDSFTDKIAVSLLASGQVYIEGRDALVIYEHLRKSFLKSAEFKQAYEHGCLKQLDEITESLVMLYCLKNRDLFN